MTIWGDALQGMGWALLTLTILPVLMLVSPRLHNLGRTVADLIDDASRWLGEAAKWLFPVLVLSVVFTVFALSIFGWASTKLDESAKYFHAFALMLGMSATLLANEHVRVDVLYTRLPERSRQRVDFCGFYVLLLPLMLAILWYSQSSTAFSWAILEGSPDADGIRGEFLLKTLIPAFAVLMIAQGMALAIRAALSMTSD